MTLPQRGDPIASCASWTGLGRGAAGWSTAGRWRVGVVVRGVPGGAGRGGVGASGAGVQGAERGALRPSGVGRSGYVARSVGGVRRGVFRGAWQGAFGRMVRRVREGRGTEQSGHPAGVRAAWHGAFGPSGTERSGRPARSVRAVRRGVFRGARRRALGPSGAERSDRGGRSGQGVCGAPSPRVVRAWGRLFGRSSVASPPGGNWAAWTFAYGSGRSPRPGGAFPARSRPRWRGTGPP